MSEAGSSECPFAQHVDAYCDGELAAALQEEMNRHVFACARCSAAVRLTNEIKESIAAAETRRLPEDVRNRIHSAAANSWDGGTMRLLRYMSGIAAVILVAASIWVARMGGAGAGNSAPSDNSSDTHVAEWIVNDLSKQKSGAGNGAQAATRPDGVAAEHGEAPAEHGEAPAEHGEAPAEHGEAPAERGEASGRVGPAERR